MNLRVINNLPLVAAGKVWCMPLKMLVSLFISLSLSSIVTGSEDTQSEIIISKYKQQRICNAQDAMDKGCFSQESSTNSHMNCIINCSLNPVCSGVLIYTSHQTCYLGKSCDLKSFCSQTDLEYKYFERITIELTTEASASTSTADLETSMESEEASTNQTDMQTPKMPIAIETADADTTKQPTEAPTTKQPTEAPTTLQPTEAPTTKQPTEAPTTLQPTEAPTTKQPTEAPTTLQPTEAQTVNFDEITRCQNGGILDRSRDVCDCTGTGGYVGNYCERAATSCTDLYDYNYDRGTHALNIDLFEDGSVFYHTTCHLKKWYSTQVSFDIMRSTGSFDTLLSYKDYVSGFRFGAEDYWIGLENLHKYTGDGRNHKIRLTVNFNSSAVTGELAISHSNFVVTPSSLGYRYTLGGSLYRGNSLSEQSDTDGFWLDDVLLSQVNIPFSTADNDQDESNNKNCAQLAQAGWWFGDCFPFMANPFGWSYWVKPGSTTDQHFHISGLDMSRNKVKEAVRYVYITLDYP